ncbi:MAG: symmetrical bis(5'-nucleosyl)-tetraphosphatase [Gammaproteobacteria bacterium]
MAVYAIGDLQGCLDPLLRLLDKVDYNPRRDQLWFTGDLVNRGPESLESLRFVKNLGDSAISVLGNHDLHLLAAVERPERLRSKDTLHGILKAPDAHELLHWLRQRPVMHHDSALKYTMVHAGLSPQWSLKTALAAARELEATLQGPDYPAFFKHMYGNKPVRWSKSLSGWERLRYITNVFTRMRFCDLSGNMDLTRKGRPSPRARKYVPWFDVPGRKNTKLRIVFGHWSTLGEMIRSNVLSIDTGCVWGGCLTALQLKPTKVKVRRVKCRQVMRPTLFQPK